MFRIGPGAARAIEPVRLVHAEETAGLFQKSLLTANGICNGFQSTPPCRRTLVIADAGDIILAHCALHGRSVLGRELLRHPTDIFSIRDNPCRSGADEVRSNKIIFSFRNSNWPRPNPAKCGPSKQQ
jgi:hypothetical protein